jgi:hypothetical protein
MKKVKIGDEVMYTTFSSPTRKAIVEQTRYASVGRRMVAVLILATWNDTPMALLH